MTSLGNAGSEDIAREAVFVQSQEMPPGTPKVATLTMEWTLLASLWISSCGVRETIWFLAEHKLVDCIVTTAGGVEEDFIKCLAPTYEGDWHLRGKDLRMEDRAFMTFKCDWALAFTSET